MRKGAQRRAGAPAVPHIPRRRLRSQGELERAAAELAEARKLVGDDRYASIVRLRAAESWGAPTIRALVEATYFAGLRKAGTPEE